MTGAGSIPRRRMWAWESVGAVSIVLLLLANEGLAFIEGWRGFLYVTLRAIVVPILGLVTATFSVIKLVFSRDRVIWRGLLAMAVCLGAVYACWIYQWPLFFR